MTQLAIIERRRFDFPLCRDLRTLADVRRELSRPKLGTVDLHPKSLRVSVPVFLNVTKAPEIVPGTKTGPVSTNIFAPAATAAASLIRRIIRAARSFVADCGLKS